MENLNPPFSHNTREVYTTSKYANGHEGDDDIIRDGSVDWRGRPARRSRTGGWRASSITIIIELLERSVFHAILGTTVLFLSKVLKQPLSEALKNTNYWAGATTVAPLFGGFLADAFLGRYLVVSIFSFVFTLGTIFLTLATTVGTLMPPCVNNSSPTCVAKPTSAQSGFSFLGLYLVIVGTTAMRPCLQSLGGDQYEEDNAEEDKNKSTFFNWWGFGQFLGILLGVTFLVYVFLNVGWGIGFKISSGIKVLSFFFFFVGTPFYRRQPITGSPLTKIVQVVVASIRKFNVTVPSDVKQLHEVHTIKTAGRHLEHSNQFRFLDKAATIRPDDFKIIGGNSVVNPWKLCTLTQVEEVKIVIRIIPVWLSVFWYGVFLGLTTTFFTMQGESMERHVGPSRFNIPSASFQAVTMLTATIGVLIYEYSFVPIARAFTGNVKGITLLQRIGTSYFIGIFSIMAAALTESRRLRSVRNGGPLMSIFWLLPQYIIQGIANIFALSGLQHFFYEQVLDGMRGLGIALYTSGLGMGRFISSLLITIIESITSQRGYRDWFGPTINTSRIDRFYWFLTVLSFINFFLFVLVAHFFQYKKPISNYLEPDKEKNED